MVSVQEKYDLGGTLDTRSTYAGNKGQNINGVEIHIFEENGTGGGTITPVGNYKIIPNVPFISQNDKYPTGCESVSTVMALQYAGINMTVENFIDNYLDKGDRKSFDPNICFGGNPYCKSGYGCYSPVIKKALDRILKDSLLYAKEVQGKSIEYLCSEYIDRDIPVIFWATQRMDPPRKSTVIPYQGRYIQWISPMHCLLLVGYDDNHYIFNDPQKHALTYYSKEAVQRAYDGLFKQAVVIKKYERPCIPNVPDDAGKMLDIIPLIRELEATYSNYYNNTAVAVPTHPVLRPEDILNGVLGYLRASEYGDRLWFLTTGVEIDSDFIKYVKETNQSLYNSLDPYISKNRLETTDGNIGIIDLSHMAATMSAYFGGIPANFWAGWGGDLATGMQDTTINIENKNNTNSPYYECTNKEIADKTIGKDTLNCNYRDFCSDFDAYKLQKKIKELKNSSETLLLSSALKWYYQAEYQKRFSVIYEELGCSSISLNILEDAIRLKMNTRSVAGLTVSDIKGGSPSDEVFLLCCESFAQYIRAMNDT